MNCDPVQLNTHAVVVQPPQLDSMKYLGDLAEFDLTEEERTELLTVLWQILAAFVQVGFGIDSVQILDLERNEAAEDDREIEDMSKGQ